MQSAMHHRALTPRSQIELLELVLPFMEYIEARRRYTEFKTKQRTLHQCVQALQQKNAPAHALKKSLLLLLINCR